MSSATAPTRLIPSGSVLALLVENRIHRLTIEVGARRLSMLAPCQRCAGAGSGQRPESSE